MTPRLTPPALTPLKLRDYLQDAFLRYYETAYELRDAGLTEERRELLFGSAGLFAEPYLELMPSYPPSHRTLPEALNAADVPEAAELCSPD